MKLKAGYKLTEVGLIPQEWGVVAIGDLNPFVTSGSRGWAEFYSERGSPFIRITNLSRESIDLDLGDMKFVNLPKISAEGIRTQLQDHDVLISITADIGIIGYVNSEIPKPAYINQHIALVRFEQDRTNGRYITYFLASEGPQKLFRASTDTGAKAGMSLITVKKIRLALPPLPEQNLIATALSDVAALITSLDKLIAKKRLIKKGAMQELLTGKRRIPRFSGEWEVKRLGEILKLRYGKSQQGIASFSGNFPILGTGGQVGKTNNYLYDKPSVIIGRKGTIDIPQYVDTPFWAIDTTYYSEVSDFAYPKFLYYLFTTINWYSYNEASGVPSLSAPTVENIEIYLPKEPEQRAIADVISDMDAEIAALEQRRDKTRLLKQGMMQELLTGRIRLVS